MCMNRIRVCMDAFNKGRSVHLVDTKWESDHIRVHYLDGSFDLRTRVAKIARQWSEISGVSFIPAKSRVESDIRVTFAPGGSWSFVGTQSTYVPRSEPTMQFGWLNESTEQEEMEQVVLHEFGHVMGLVHEHKNPEGGVQWDMDRVYAYYTGYPNYWSRRHVEEIVFNGYNADITKRPEFDPDSIMLFHIPKAFTINEYEVGWNSSLSNMDKRFVSGIYR